MQEKLNKVFQAEGLVNQAILNGVNMEKIEQY